MRIMIIGMLSLFGSATGRADELGDAKQKYLSARRAATKELYDSYKKAVGAAEIKGESIKAEKLRQEMAAFVATEQDALDAQAKFDLFAAIEKAFTEIADA